MHSITGIHHITAIAADAQQNLDFYAGMLGLRLVKLTVNFDDPGSYHLYYGDAKGTPGSILTFFAWPGAWRGRRGNSQVTATTFAIPKGALPFWIERLATRQIAFEKSVERFGDRVVSFADPDGLQLELVEAPVSDSDSDHPWTAPDIPRECAIRGFHSATLSETGYERTALLLTETMGLRLEGQERNRFRYRIDSGGPRRIVDVLCTPDAPEGRVAVGTVHHIAWRTPDDAQQGEWLSLLTKLGYNVSPVMDRTYFHSIYYREPGSVLFEIATDPPGFTADEPLEELGTHLKLPPWLETQRPRIELALPPLKR